MTAPLSEVERALVRALAKAVLEELRRDREKHEEAS